MAKLETLAKKRADWRGKVAIVAVSEDESPTTSANHAAARGWTSLELVHDRGGRARSVLAASLPETVLADAAGKVAWRGHPTEIDLEREVDLLLGKN